MSCAVQTAITATAELLVLYWSPTTDVYILTEGLQVLTTWTDALLCSNCILCGHT